MKSNFWLNFLYGCLLKLYPARFQEGFGQEMQEIFIHSTLEAAQESNMRAVGVLLREVRDLPGSLLRAYWSDIEEVLMHEKGYASNGWGSAVLAGLPHLLIGLGSSLPALLVALGTSMPILRAKDGPSFYITDLIYAALILSLIIFAWRKGWPTWSASLYGYGAILLAVVISTVLNQIEFVRAGGFFWVGLIFFVVLLVSLVGGLLALTFRRPIQALLIMLPLVFLLWGIILEFTSPLGRAVAVMLASLAVAASAAFILRRGKLNVGLLAALGVSFLVGLLYAVARTYFVNQEAYAFLQAGNLADLAGRLILPFATLSTIILGPFLLRLLRQQVAQLNQNYLFSLALTGLILELGGILFAHIWLQMSHDTVKNMGLPDTPGLISGYASYLGAVVFMVFAGLLVFRSRSHTRMNSSAILLLVLVLVLLPPLVVLPLAFGYRNIPQAMPFGLHWLQNQPILFVYALAGAWVVVATWIAIMFTGPFTAPYTETGQPSPAK